MTSIPTSAYRTSYRREGGPNRPVTIEPQQDAFRKLIKNYKNISGEFYYENVAVGGTDGIVKMFTIRYARGYLSITDGGVASIFYNHVYLHAEKHIRKRKLQIPPEDLIVSFDVPVVSINTALERNAFSNIDIVVIDAEGMDGEIIHALDFQKYFPKIVLFESKHMEWSMVSSINRKLRNLGYDIYSFGRDAVAIESLGKKSNKWMESP